MQESPIHFVSHTEIIKFLELTLSNYIVCIQNPGTTTKDLLKFSIQKPHPVQDGEKQTLYTLFSGRTKGVLPPFSPPPPDNSLYTASNRIAYLKN